MATRLLENNLSIIHTSWPPSEEERTHHISFIGREETSILNIRGTTFMHMYTMAATSFIDMDTNVFHNGSLFLQECDRLKRLPFSKLGSICSVEVRGYSL